MLAIELPGYGAPDVLRPVDRPEPDAPDGAVLVAVAAATVNPVDLAVRAGAFRDVADLPLPVTLGWDFAGTVLADAGGFAAGQRVAGMVPWFDAPAGGAYAEVVVADPAWLVPLPDGLEPVTAATLPLNGLTARQALDHAALQAGQVLLVDRASGGVGGFAVQLAAAAGVRVIAVAASGDEAHVEALGAEVVVPRGDAAALAAAVRRVVPEGTDAAIDSAPHGTPLLAAVRDGGTFVTVAGAPPEPERGIRVERQMVVPAREQLQAVVAAHSAGGLRTRVAGTLRLADAGEAHRRAEAGGLRGKLVLTS